jgi:hypothetical protein
VKEAAKRRLFPILYPSQTKLEIEENAIRLLPDKVGIGRSYTSN